jgi:SpoVK/Ycf46/Vps4 family AAA+-type ATPase
LGVRKIKDVLHNSVTNEEVNHVFIMLGHTLQIPDEMKAYTEVIDYSLPNREQIHNFIVSSVQASKETIEDMASDPVNAALLANRKVDYTPEEINSIVEACLGLSIYEILTQIAKSLAKLDKLDPKFILQAKQQIVHKSDIMEWIEPNVSLNDIGGADNLKAWFHDRKASFSDEAKEFGLESPKGVLMVGIPGTGKSMSAKALGNIWGVPLLHLDVGKIMSGIVVCSEGNIRKALKTAEAIAPCILWVDEIEKGFSGTGSSNMSDGGTMARVFGTFLTWMQEKEAPVFVVATANNISQLPPELMRKGRFDEIFFIDLPGDEERAQILGLHLKKRKQDPSNFDLDLLAKESEGFSGAELEHVIKDGMYVAFSSEEKKLTTNMVLREIKKTVPLSEAMKKEIDAVKEVASRMRFASNKSLNAHLNSHNITDQKPVMKPRGSAESLI